MARVDVFDEYYDDDREGRPVTQFPVILDQFFKISGDTVQNIEVVCTKCKRNKLLPLIYFDTYDEEQSPFPHHADVRVVKTIADMLYEMWDHIAKIHGGAS